MIFVFYNKLLLRILVALIGIGIGVAAFQYIRLLEQKLPGSGALDALAIVGFLIAGWLALAAAEVLDNHYARVYGGLCVGLGAFVSYPWMFRIDGPQLITMPGAQPGFRMMHLGFSTAIGLAAILLIILVTRLIMDRLNYGRAPAAAAVKRDVDLGARPATLGVAPAQPDLPPIPVDASPLSVTSGVAAATASGVPQAPPREAGPVQRLTGIGGLYLGTQFELTPGESTVGRQGADLLLPDDNQVSRLHAVLTVTADGLAEVRDNGSTNGTYLNNQRIDHSQLAPGDVLRVGTTLFKVEGR
jgi:hypothetical protein